MNKDCEEDQRERQQDGAERRVDWAEDRTILANERTFAAWIRSGLAALAVAIGLHAVFSEAQPTWAAKATASLFIVAAILIFVFGAHRSFRTQKRIDSHDAASQPSWRMVALAAILALGALAVSVILWLI